MLNEEPSPSWAKGYSIDKLKQYSSIFSYSHKNLVFGAFGLIKERDIASALDENKLLSIYDPPEAVLIYSELKTPSTHTTFSDRSILIPKNSFYIKEFACFNIHSGTDLIQKFIDKFGELSSPGFFGQKKQIWIEIFEEDGKAKSVLKNFAFRYVGTKISAGSEIKGLYLYKYATKDYEEPIEEAATLVELQKNYLTNKKLDYIRQELKKADEYWEQHYSNYNKRNSWTSFCLRGYDKDDPKFIIKPQEMSRKWKDENKERLNSIPQDTIISDLFPCTWEVVNSIPGKKDRVRFMQLRAEDGELTRHADITDREAGVSNGKVCRLHIPIITSRGVIFKGWNHRGKLIEKEFDEGTLFYLDQRKPHAVVNASEVNRIHLVIDCFSYNEVRQLIIKGMNKL